MQLAFHAAVAAVAIGGLSVLLALRIRSRRLERAMRFQRALFSEEVVYRPVEEGEKNLIALLDAPQELNADLTSDLQRLPDIVMVSRSQSMTVLMRPYVDDIGNAAYIVVIPGKDGTHTSFEMETYAHDEVLRSVPGSRDLIAMPPFCKSSYPSQRLSMAEKLRHHRAFTARERDTSRNRMLSNADDVATALQSMHDMILTWRRSMTADELLERDLQAWLGRGYERGRARWKRALAA